MKQRKTFTEWLTTRLLFVVRDEENFAELKSFKFTYAKLIFLFMLTGAFFFVINLFLVITVLSKQYNPAYAEKKIDQKVLALYEQVDSLEHQMELKDQFLKSILDIGNEEEVVPDKKSKNDTARITELDEGISSEDSLFRKQFEEDDTEWISAKTSFGEELGEYLFFLPVSNGVISNKFDVKEGHYGIDVVAKKNEPIKSVSDGTVVLSSWTQDAGYVIAVQHKNQIISFYKHNSVLLKKTGDFVRAGDVLAIIVDTGEYTDGPHLHFELWYKGNPVDPLEFLSF